MLICSPWLFKQGTFKQMLYLKLQLVLYQDLQVTW